VSNINLAPVLTGCHVCRSPFADMIGKRMKEGLPDTKISAWLESEGQYFSRITLGKHRREHLTTDFEKAKADAVKIMEKRKKTLKPTAGVDLASLVRDYTFSAVESGELVPTLSEGLRAQEILDRRQEKGADRDLAFTLAAILGGSSVVNGTATLVEPNEIVEVISGENSSLAAQGGAEPEGRPEREGESLLQGPDGRDAEGPSEERGQPAEGIVPSSDGEHAGTGEGREGSSYATSVELAGLGR